MAPASPAVSAPRRDARGASTRWSDLVVVAIVPPVASSLDQTVFGHRRHLPPGIIGPVDDDRPSGLRSMDCVYIIRTDGRWPVPAHRPGNRSQERTYQALRGALLDGVYLPGERIYEGARGQGAGRQPQPRPRSRAPSPAGRATPGSAALRNLRHDDPAEEIEDVYRIRAALEATAAALAAERMTDQEIEELGAILLEQQQAARLTAAALLGSPSRSCRPIASITPSTWAPAARDSDAPRADLRAGDALPEA